MWSLGSDVRSALRSLRRRPGFTVLAAGTLAAGIGLATAAFSAVDHVLLRPLPFESPERLVILRELEPGSAAERDASPALFLGWRESVSAFDAVVAVEPYGFDIATAAGVETVPAWRVSDGFFQLLGVAAQRGRVLLPGDFEPGAPPVVVLSHGFWQRRFGGDEAIIGRTVVLDRSPRTVVGIMPPAFRFPDGREMWAPRAFDESDRQDQDAYYTVVARLAPGATLPQAGDELRRVTAALVETRPAELRVSAIAVPLFDRIVGPSRPMLLMLAGSAGFVLLIACSNVAHLLLVRGLRQRHALAIRGALGASPGRLTRELLVEHTILALLAGLGGVAVALWLIDALSAIQPEGLLPRVERLAVDGRVLAFALVAAIASALVSGLAPALRFGRADLRGGLQAGSRRHSDPGERHVRGGLMAAEVALAVVLVVCAGLLVRSLVTLTRTDPGFEAANRAEIQVFLWDQFDQEPARAEFVRRALDDLAGLPSVRSAAAVSALSYARAWIDMESSYRIEGLPETTGGAPIAYATVTTPGYFRTIGIPVRRGRDFTFQDAAGAPPVVIVNEALADRHWPGEDPIGRRIEVGVSGPPIMREIVGVVGNVRQGGLDREPRPELFVPHAQSPFGSMTFVVETAGDPGALLPVLRSRLWSLKPDLPIYHSATLRQLLSDSVADRRFATGVLTIFALLAIALACVGVYGVVSFVVSERTREFGIRLALGAGARDLVRTALADGLLAVSAGVGVGIVGALLVSRFLRGMLHAVQPADPLTYLTLALAVVALATFACWLPARRASRVDPLTALRAD